MNFQRLDARFVLSECLWGGNRSTDKDFVTDGRALFYRPSIGATALDERGPMAMLPEGLAAMTWHNAINAPRVEVSEFYVDPDGRYTPTVECYGETKSEKVRSCFEAMRLAMVLSIGHAADSFALIDVPSTTGGKPVPALLGISHGGPTWVLTGMMHDLEDDQ